MEKRKSDLWVCKHPLTSIDLGHVPDPEHCRIHKIHSDLDACLNPLYLEEVRSIIHRAHERAKDVLSRHREQLDRIADWLIEVETLDADEFVALFEGTSDTEPSAPDAPPTVPGAKRAPRRDAAERRKPSLDMPPAPFPA